MDGKRSYVVGVVCPEFVDQGYIRDRDLRCWAVDDKDAINQFYEERKTWLRDDEKKLVKILSIDGVPFVEPQIYVVTAEADRDRVTITCETFTLKPTLLGGRIHRYIPKDGGLSVSLNEDEFKHGKIEVLDWNHYRFTAYCLEVEHRDVTVAYARLSLASHLKGIADYVKFAESKLISPAAPNGWDVIES